MSEIIKRIKSFLAEAGIEVEEKEKALIIADVLKLKANTSAKSLKITKYTGEGNPNENGLLHKQGGFTIDLTDLANIGQDTFVEIDIEGNVTYDLDKKPAKLSATWNTDDETKPHLIFGVREGSRIQADKMFGQASMDFHPNLKETKVVAEGRISGGKFALKFGKGDGDSFLDSILPSEGFTANFDLDFGLSSERGLFFKGSSGLELVIPLHLELGPIDLKSIAIGAFIDSQKKAFGFQLGISAGASLGPFDLVVENIGIKGQFIQNDQGQILDQFDFEMDFKPPQGIGLALDLAGMVKGGGYIGFFPDKGEYHGAAELAIIELVHVKALCIITTKLPDGKPGFSFFLLITAEFSPVQLGFGFTLNGVGGMVGINRAMDTDAIIKSVRNNTLQDILFPENPIADAPRIFRTIGQIFPVQRDEYTFGLMAIIGWGVPTLIEARLGFFIQLPTVKISILGILECNIPHKALPIIVLKAAFDITFDSSRKLIAFNASLFESRILWMELYGDLALRIKYGDNAGFLLSIGGFHPEYTPPADMGVGPMRRATIVLFSGNPNLQIEAYFAVTSNTVQFGARLDFYLDLGIVSVIGYFGFDALIQFSPFYFKISIEAYLKVQAGSATLLSVYVFGALSGPNPWNIRGIGEFSALGLSFEIEVDITWPDDYQQEQLESIEVLPLLLEALNDTRNWEIVFPRRTNSLTTLRDTSSEISTTEDTSEGAEQVNTLMAHPFCTFIVRQKILPFNVPLSRFGQFQPVDGNKFTLREKEGFFGNLDTDKLSFVKDQFAADQFFNLSETEKLHRPGFEAFDSGLILQDRDFIVAETEEDTLHPIPVHTKRQAGNERAEWDDYNIGKGGKKPDIYEETPIKPEIFDWGIQQTLVARSTLGQQASFKQQHIQSAPSLQQTFRLTDKNTLQTVEQAGIQSEFNTVTEAEAALSQLSMSHPGLAKHLQVSMQY